MLLRRTRIGWNKCRIQFRRPNQFVLAQIKPSVISRIQANPADIRVYMMSIYLWKMALFWSETSKQRLDRSSLAPSELGVKINHDLAGAIGGCMCGSNDEMRDKLHLNGRTSPVFKILFPWHCNVMQGDQSRAYYATLIWVIITVISIYTQVAFPLALTRWLSPSRSLRALSKHAPLSRSHAWKEI